MRSAMSNPISRLPVTAAAAPAELEPRVVLVVEDDASVRDALGELLARPGREVLVSPDGRDAQEALAGGAQPCVILLDWNMPRVDGEAFLRWRADRAALRDVPVVVMTAAQGVGGDARAQAVLQKPVDVERVRSIVRGACERLCSRRAACPFLDRPPTR